VSGLTSLFLGLLLATLPLAFTLSENSFQTQIDYPKFRFQSIFANENQPAAGILQGNHTIEEDAILYGPHIIVNGTWDELNIPGFPTVKIRQTCLEFYQWNKYEFFGEINQSDPIQMGWHPDLNPREDYGFVNLSEGNRIWIALEFGLWVDGVGSSLIHRVEDDLDLFVWPPGVNHTWANSLTGKATPTCCRNPEEGWFIAPVTGNYTIGIDLYSGLIPMDWSLNIWESFIAYNETADGRSVIVDTANIGNNDPCDVCLRLITGTSLDKDNSFATYTVENVTFVNFFRPIVTVLSPNGGEIEGPDPITIRWIGTDLNQDEVLHYSVEISNDSGSTWFLIVTDTTASEITWDPFGEHSLPRGDQYLVRVNVTDGRWSASDTSNAVWSLYLGPGGPPTFRLIEIILACSVIAIVALSIILVLFVHRYYVRRRVSKATSESTS
jgi:hypothetical protein